jgi:proline-specific peptidase
MERMTTADGRTLAYRRLGSGPKLVCHPGGPGFSSRYLADLGGLDRELELILLDPRGTGESDPAADPRGYLIEDYAGDVEELREHLGLEQLNLLGHSHGGVVGMEYAATHPERVEHLILASTLPTHGPDQEVAMQAAIESRSGEPWYADAREALEAEAAATFADGAELAELCRRMMPFYYAHYGEREQAHVASLEGDKVNPDATRQWESELWEHFDLRPKLARIAAPTLVLTGEEDFIAGPAAQEFEALPNSRRVVIEDCGHISFVEAPEAFREAVLSFLGVAAAA